MKRNISKLGLALFACLLAVGAYAGEQHDMKDSAKHLAKLTKKLELSDAQVPQVEAILANAQARAAEIRSSYTLDQRKEAREAMEATHETARTEMAAVLTAEQMEKMDAMHEKRMKRRHKRKHNHDKHEGEHDKG